MSVHRLLGVLFACIAPLAAQRALLDTLPPEADVAEHWYIGFGGEWDRWELPGEGAVFGFARIADRCWVARGDKLHCVEWPSRRDVRSVEAPKDLIGICADERFVYGIAGRTLHVLDPVAGTSLRSETLPTTWPPSAITMHGGALHLLVDLTVMKVDLERGTVSDVEKFATRPHWIASDGVRWWRGTGFDCRPFGAAAASAKPDAWAGRTWPWPVDDSAAAWIDGRLLVAFERRDFAGRVRLSSGLLAPSPGVPSERLLLDVLREEGKVVLTLDGEPIDGDAELTAALRRRRDPDSSPARAVVIEPHPGVTVRDVCKVWDVAVAAGCTSVHCPPLEGWVRRKQAAAAAAGKGDAKKP